MISDSRLDAYRELAAHLLDYACNGMVGRGENDPIYRRVTEGRDVGAMQRRYSSCADLAHWLFYRLGVRAPWVNRAEHVGWRVGRNVGLLCGRPVGGNRHSRAGAPVEPPHAGDVLVIYNRADGTDAHVACVLDATTDALRTAEYGQPGGATKRYTFPPDKAFLALGGRRIQWVLPLADVLSFEGRALAAPDLSPLEGWLTGEELDELSGRLAITPSGGG